MPNKASTSADSSKSAGTLSCVIPAYNEADNLARLLPMLHDELDRTGMAWEIIVVNDGSRDHTFDTLASLSEQIRGVRAVHFSRNFGKEAAITAGIDMAHGDAVIIMDADLQHSPSLIPVMLQHWREGAEVVYAIRSHREDEKPLKQIGTRLFYRAVNRGARFGIPPDAGDFRLMDRKVVLALRRLPERNRFMKGLYAWAGFRTVAIPYQPLTRESGLSHFNAIKLLHFAIDGMTAFTTWPLRVVTLIVCILLFSGLQMMSLGVMGEYIARIFEEVKRRPVYIVSEEHGSGLPRKRRNTLYPLSGGANTVHPDLPDPLPDDVTLQ